MIKLPNFKKAFEYENNFYLSCDIKRISKLLLHYELFKKTVDVPGDIFEFGVFKGISFVNFAAMRNILNVENKKLIGFDTFDKFPITLFEEDKEEMYKFFEEAGDSSIAIKQMKKIFKNKKIENYELVEGNIIKTLPEYLLKNPQMKCCFINLDTDVYEPAVLILDRMYDHLSPGGVMVFDDYNVFPGETLAVDSFLKNKKEKLEKISMIKESYFIIKL